MIRIVTDTTAGVPEDMIKKYNLVVIPLNVIFGDQTYRDGVDISCAEFYRRLPHSDPLPTTSQPSSGDFEEAFRRAGADGNEVLAILISSKLSGTVASAMAARGTLSDMPITIFDSLQTTAPQALMVQYAAEQAAAGASMESIVADLEKLRGRARVLFTVATFHYLRKGGRIGGASALAASLLRIQPIITIQDGLVDAWGKVRGKKRALKTMVDAIRENAGTGDQVRVIVVHGDDPEAAAELAADVERQIGCPAPVYTDLSSTLGVHVGPGAVGLGYISLDWLKD